MYFWQDIMSPPLPTVRTLMEEVRALPNLNELEGIFHIGWEEGAHEIYGYLNTPNGAEILAEELNKLSTELGRDIPFYLITAAPDRDWPHEWDRNDPKYRLLKLIHYPTYFFQRTQFRLGPNVNQYWSGGGTEHIQANYEHNKNATGLDIANLYTGLDNVDYKYTYLYMVLYPKPHRCIMMDTLAKHELHSIGALSWMEYNRNIDRSKLLPGQLDSQYEDFVWTHWKNPQRLYLDQKNESPGPISWDWLPSEYSQSFMQVIGESVAHCTFITEKTVVPILHNKPFLIVGSQGNHQYLKELGFELYDEIFDYGFDNLSNIKDRCDGIAENIKRVQSLINSQGAQNLINRIRDKLIHNKRLGHQITFLPQYFPHEVNLFLNCNNLIAQKSVPEQWRNIKKHYPYFDYSKRFYNEWLTK